MNSQEKRNSLDSAFGEKSEALSTYDFWEKIRVFSATDAKRMKDIEYCCGIYILANEFIVNQTDDKIVNTYYDDFSDSFDEDNMLLNRIEDAMECILKLVNKSTVRFISKKAQLYSLFALYLKLLEDGSEIDDSFSERFSIFVEVYSKFRNEYVYAGKDENNQRMYELLKRYKLASSEGVNKLQNRMLRYEILYELYNAEEDMQETLQSLGDFFDEQKKKNNNLMLESDDIID